AEEHRQLPALAGRGGAGRRRGQLRWSGGLPCHEPVERSPALAAELLAGLVRRATRGARHGERCTAFGTEAPFGAVVVITGRAAHRVAFSCGDYHDGREPRNGVRAANHRRAGTGEKLTATLERSWN